MVHDPTENKRTLAARQKEANRIIRINRGLRETGKVQYIENRKSNTQIFFENANEMKRGFKLKHTIKMGDRTLLIENYKKYRIHLIICSRHF